MPIRVEDLVGLNPTEMQDMPLVANRLDAQALLSGASTAQPLSIAGARCSQGGHTSAAGGRMLVTQTLNRAAVVDLGGYDATKPRQSADPSVLVDAGMTWSELHHVLLPLGLATRVQQSSAQFSIGGAISVNCHGRDPRQGPIGNTVRWLDVLCGDGVVRRTSATEEPELFSAVIGGYGSCGLILRASLSLCPNLVLDPVAERVSMRKYAKRLRDLAEQADTDTQRVELHHGWFRCVDLDSLFEQVHVVDCKDAVMPQADTTGQLPVEEWGTTEILRAAWDEGRKGYGNLRGDLWDMVMRMGSRRQVGRLVLQRPAMGFAAHRGHSGCDVLQEYFVPLDRFLELVDGLRAIFRGVDGQPSVNVLSATARLLPRDRHPIHLSYCPPGGKAMVSFAVEAAIAVDPRTRAPAPAAGLWAEKAMGLARDLGGNFYLPYFGFAERGRFRTAYPGWTRQVQAMDRYNPGRRFSNQFVARYLAAEP